MFPFDQEGFELNRPRRPTILGFRAAGTWDRIANDAWQRRPAQMRRGLIERCGLPVVLTLYDLRGRLRDRSGSGGNAPMRAATSGGTR